MATCSSSFRAICLGLALLAAKASADQRQPPALATLETLPMYSETSGDNEYDRGQEYILAMPPHGSQPSPPTATFETDGYTDGTQGEDRGSWKVAAIPTTSDSRGALFFDGAASELGNMYNAAVMRKFIEQQKPIETEQTSELGNMYHAAVMRKFLEQQKPFETEQTSELGNMYNAAVMKKFLEQQKPFETEQTSELGNMYNAAVLRKFLGQQKPIMSKAYDVDPEVLLAKYLENQKFFGQQKPVVEVDSDAAFRHYFEQQKPIASQTYEVDSDGALRQYFEQQKPIVSQSYEVDSDAALRKYFEQQNPIVGQTYEVDSDAAFRKYFEQQQPIVSQTFEVDSDAALRKYFEQQKPIVSQTFDVDSTSAFRRYLEQQKPIVKTTEVLSDPIFKHSYSVQPVYNVKKYTQVQPVVHKSVTVLPPPIVRKLFKVLPTPVIRKYFTAPPVVQHVRESPSHVFNKFVKNVIVQHPQQRQDPFVVLPPSSKNVYNLIKLAAPTPKPTIPESTTPEPITEAPTTVAPTTTSPLPLKAEALVAQKDEAEEEEEVTEEQKLKSVGKMVVVETVRRVVDVPEFDGPAPPPARSEETVVEPDGTVRKFEKYIEYDQVSGNQQAAAGVRATHSKKQSSSKSGYAAQVSPVLVDAAKTATAASPGTARLLHSATFSGPAALQGSPAFLLGGGSSSFDSLTRTQFAKALSQPIHVKEAAASLAPEEALSQQRTDAVPLEQEHHELPSEMVEHWTTEPPALPKEAATVPPFA